jgi:hypothetical protein
MAMGVTFRRHFAVGRDWPVTVPEALGSPYGKITLAWALITLTPLAIWFGPRAATATLVKVMLSDYLSFILLLVALYTVAGGILISGLG